MLLVVSQRTKAGTIYDLQNYPADQNGHTLSGTITTDGTIGSLQASNITSWNVTIDANDNFSSHDTGAFNDSVGPGLVATPTELTFAISPSAQPINTVLGLGTFIQGGPQSSVSWYSQDIHGDSYYVAWFQSPPPYTPNIWNTENPVMGGIVPWVIAVAQTTAVPEPSALVLAGSAIVSGLAYGLARKRRAQRKARNE